MPTEYREKILRLLRDFQGYTGDGQGGSGALPTGDRATARKSISNRDLRDLFLDSDNAAEAARQSALDAQEAALYSYNTPGSFYADEEADYPVGGVVATKDGASVEIVASSGDLAHPVTAQLLRIRPVNGCIRAYDLPDKADPGVRISNAAAIANDHLAQLDARGLGKLACAAPITLVQGMNAYFYGTTLGFGDNNSQAAIRFELDNPDWYPTTSTGRRPWSIDDLTLLGPIRAEGGNPGLLKVGLSYENAEADRSIRDLHVNRPLIEGFHANILWGSNVYLHTYNQGRIGFGNKAVMVPSGLSNQGERIVFSGMLFSASRA